MSASEKTQTIIELVKIKSWYVPGNTASYQVLKNLGVPLTKIHSEFIPTLQLLMKQHGVRAKGTSFRDKLDAMLEKVGTQWQSRKGRRCQLAESRLVFMAKGEQHRKAFSALDNSLAQFFARWGYRYIAEFSDVQGRMKLVVDYRFDPERNPVIPTVEAVPKTVTEFEMGFTKFRLTFNDKTTSTTKDTGRTRTLPPTILIEVFEQSGSEWRPRYQSTCVDAQIGNLTQALQAFSLLHARRQIIEARA